LIETGQNLKTGGKKYNCPKVMETDNRIAAILVCLRGRIANIYA